MLCPNFETADVPYRTFGELPKSYFPWLIYHPEIFGSAAHRATDTAECIAVVNGLYASPDGGTYPDSGAIYVVAQTDVSFYPGWQSWAFRFDAESGVYVGATPFYVGFFGLTGGEVRQGTDGALWVAGRIPERIMPLTPAGVADESRALFPGDFGYIQFGPYLVDPGHDLFLNAAGNTLDIWQLSTRTRLGQMALPETLLDLCAEEGTRCYLLTTGRAVLLLDYGTRRWLGAVRAGQGPIAFIAWDKRYRRLLTVTQPAGLGLGFSSYVTGYRMRPVATHLCPPIPLDPPRAGRPGRVLVKTTGDRGEGIPGTVAIAGDFDGQNAVALDGYGEGVALLTPSSAGAAAITLTLEVPCLP